MSRGVRAEVQKALGRNVLGAKRPCPYVRGETSWSKTSGGGSSLMRNVQKVWGRNVLDQNFAAKRPGVKYQGRNVQILKVLGPGLKCPVPEGPAAKYPGHNRPGAKRPFPKSTGRNVLFRNIRGRNVQVQKVLGRNVLGAKPPYPYVRGETSWSKSSGGGMSWVRNVQVQNKKSGGETSWNIMSGRNVRMQNIRGTRSRS